MSNSFGQEKNLIPDYIVWMDTIKEGARFEDTNKMFEKPDNFDVKVTHKDNTYVSYIIKQDILEKFND